MKKVVRARQVYYPETINELLAIYNTKPEAIIYAGGTGILKSQRTKYPMNNRDVIYISNIEELSMIRRSEGYVEIGACATLSNIIGIGEHVLKPSLHRALLSIATKEVRNIATIGGNICNRFFRKNLVPLLSILDTKVELKRQDKSRWISIKQFISNEGGVEQEEILTRIRIPFNKFNHQQFVVAGNLKSNFESVLIFSCLASVQKEVITSLRFTAGYGGNKIFRAKSFEETLIGKKLPLYDITLNPAYTRLKTALASNTEEMPAFQQKQIEGLFLSFMHNLNDSI